MPSTSILALDLATQTGWAAWHKHVTSVGSAHFKGTVGEALNAYQLWLIERAGPLCEGGLVIVFETPWVGPKTHQDVARKLQGLAGVTEMVAHQLGVRCMEANNASVLLHFTGKGGGKRKEKKARTITACNERGFHPRNDDEADAIALLDYAAHYLRVKTDIPEGPLFGERMGAAA
jgi:hypothetical protein